MAKTHLNWQQWGMMKVDLGSRLGSKPEEQLVDWCQGFLMVPELAWVWIHAQNHFALNPG